MNFTECLHFEKGTKVDSVCIQANNCTDMFSRKTRSDFHFRFTTKMVEDLVWVRSRSNETQAKEITPVNTTVYSAL